MVSERCDQWLSQIYALSEGMKLAMQDPYNMRDHPDGCINLGAAENILMFDELQSKIATCKQVLDLKLEDIRYNDMTGSGHLKAVTADFLNRHLDVPDEIAVRPNEISYHNGCGSAVESLFHVMCDADDVVLCPSPYYGGFDMDLERRAHVCIVAAPCDANSYRVSLPILQKALDDGLQLASSLGTRVRCLLIMNPHNPLGIVYSEQEIEMMAQFCRDNQLQFVVDEIYAFSVFDNSRVRFKSVLAMQQLLQSGDDYYRENVHFLWGLSKDFCVNGFRVGVCVSRNQRVMAGMNELAYFTCIPTVMMKLVACLLSDREWCQKFFHLNRGRLLEAYKYITDLINEFNQSDRTRNKIEFTKAQAGFFLWVDFSSFLGVNATKEQERKLYLDFIQKAKVYIAPGAMAFHANKAGTFRIIFAANQHVMRTAMERIFRMLEQLERAS